MGFARASDWVGNSRMGNPWTSTTWGILCDDVNTRPDSLSTLRSFTPDNCDIIGTIHKGQILIFTNWMPQQYLEICHDYQMQILSHSPFMKSSNLDGRYTVWTYNSVASEPTNHSYIILSQGIARLLCIMSWEGYEKKRSWTN
jgi:hypothetical protein